MDIPQLASRVRFVLCEPAHPGNIGSAARAIKTMGFRDLRVVAPREPGYRTHEEAVAYATTFAWALTGYDREFGPPMSPLRPAAERSVAWLDEMEGDIAFVFGTERSGMTNEEVMLCQGCAAIAADPASPSLNLAQAVQITAYEMHMALMAAEGHEGELYDWQSRFEHEQPASVEAVEGFFRHWEEAMTACGVHDPANPKFLMPITRRLFGRSGLTQTEIDLLRGICAAIIRPKRERKGSKTGA